MSRPRLTFAVWISRLRKTEPAPKVVRFEHSGSSYELKLDECTEAPDPGTVCIASTGTGQPYTFVEPEEAALVASSESLDVRALMRELTRGHDNVLGSVQPLIVCLSKQLSDALEHNSILSADNARLRREVADSSAASLEVTAAMEEARGRSAAFKELIQVLREGAHAYAASNEVTGRLRDVFMSLSDDTKAAIAADVGLANIGKLSALADSVTAASPSTKVD